MPIYEYQCGDCGHQMEVLQKISDDKLTDCPACDKPALNKLVSAAGFRLSGSGWYETDFKTGSKKNLAGDKSDSGSGSGGQSKDGGNAKNSTNKSSTDKSSTNKSSTGKSNTNSKDS